MAEIEQQIIRQAMQNHGVCGRAELLEHGVSRAMISHRLSSGFLERRASDVYVVPALANPMTALAVALAAAHSSVASHYTAIQLHGLVVPKHKLGRGHEILLPYKRSHPLEGIVMHSTRCLPASHVTAIAGFPATTPERTVCDVVFRQSPRAANHLVQRAIADGLVEAGRLAASHLALARRGRNGTVFTRELLDNLLGRESYPLSELEIRIRQLFDDHHLSGFVSQYQPPWYDGASGIVDFADPQARTIVEGDGRRWHAIEQAQIDDRRRDRVAQRNGWRVVRVTWAEVVHDPATIADDISAIRAQQTQRLAS